MDNKSKILKVDEDFRRLVLPLSQTQVEQLKADILQRGIPQRVFAWYNSILLGYEAYEICVSNGIPFEISRIAHMPKEKAMIWLVMNQLSRKDIPNELHKYLIGKRCALEQIMDAHRAANMYAQNPNAKPRKSRPKEYGLRVTQIRIRLGEEYHMSHGTIRKYCVFSEMLDNLYRISPVLAENIRLGRVKLSHEHLEELLSLPAKERMYVCEQLTSGDADSNYSAARGIIAKSVAEAKENELILPSGSIKDMPSYDPDAEIKSLALTIPSWVSSIKRVQSITDFSATSTPARDKLRSELLSLHMTVDKMISIIEVTNHGQL